VGKNESSGVVDHKYDDYRLNIFKMTTNNNEPVKELMPRGLLDF
jgi:hypothetical protein